MLDLSLMQVLLLLVAAGGAGVASYVIAYPFLTGERRADQRIQGIAKSKANKAGANRGEEGQSRRKQVQDTLKEIERKQKAKNRVTMRLCLLRAGLDVTPQQFYIASTITGAVGFVSAIIGGVSMPVAALIGFTAAFGLPRWLLGYLAKRRQGKFMAEFANALDIIVRGVKSGLPLGECLEIIARESPEPIRTEFADLVESQRLGMTLADCFDRMMERTPLPEVNFFAIVIAIQQQAGGNLAEALGNLSGVLRSRTMLRAKVKALSAEAKASAAILAAMPFVIIFMVYLTSPDYIELLFTEKMGHILLTAAGIWMSIGLLVMRQMINFKY